MTEFLELRFPYKPPHRKFVEAHFAQDELHLTGDYLKVLVARVRLDPCRERLKALEDLKDILWYWRIDRKYTKDEIQQAEIFRLDWKASAVSNQGGEEDGYDESSACSVCGAGRVQKSDLILNVRQLPKRKGFARTLSDEVLVSQEAAEVLLDHKLTGFRFRSVRHHTSRFDGPVTVSAVPTGRELIEKAALVGTNYPSPEFSVWMNRKENSDLANKMMAEGEVRAERLASRRPLPIWYQMVPSGQPVSLSPATQFGYTALDPDIKGEYRCPFGHTEGWSLLSEAYVKRSSWDGSDYCVTTQLYGQHPPGSLFYARPLFLISRKMRSVLAEAEVPGVRSEVAHLVGE